MNPVIAKLFEQTADAVVVEEFLGEQIGSTFIDEVTLKPHAEEILAEAKRRKQEKEAKK